MKLNGFNTFDTRYEVLRSGGVIGTLSPSEAAEIKCDAESDMVLAMSGVFFDEQKDFDFLRDRLRPIVVLNDQEYALGTYVVTTEEREMDGGESHIRLEGYSVLYLAQQKKIETRLHIPASENYIEEITALLSLAGITAINATPTDHVFATDREDWEIGTSVLTIVNALLEEISYNKAFVDLDGNVILSPYKRPSLSGVKNTYTEGVDSLILPKTKSADDRWGKANVFRVVCNNPDMEEPMVAVAENNSESSPFSIQNMGMRILQNEEVDNVPSQEALQLRADMIRDKSLEMTEEITFYTALAPVHNPRDTVAIDVGGVSGIFEETGWKISMSAGDDMEHTARRVIV